MIMLDRIMKEDLARAVRTDVRVCACLAKVSHDSSMPAQLETSGNGLLQTNRSSSIIIYI